MAGKPTFKNNDAQLECICDASGKPKKLKLASWVNPKKDAMYDEEKLKACDQIRDLVIEHNLQFRVVFKEPVDDDYKNDKELGAVNIFANTPYVAPEDKKAAPAAAPQGGGFGSFGK
jgi:hypothetical protein